MNWLGYTKRDRRVSLTLLAFVAVGWPVMLALTMVETWENRRR